MAPRWAQTGQTPPHTIRIPDELWAKAKTKAEYEGTYLSRVINNYLIKYTSKMPTDEQLAARARQRARRPKAQT